MTKTLASSAPRLLVAAIYERNGCPSWQKVVAVLHEKGYNTIVKGRGNVFGWKADEER
jgi:hypothetical protein